MSRPIPMQVPVISTGHLDQATAERLTEQGDSNDWCPCAPWHYGYFLYLDAPDEGAPQCLLDITDWLQKHGFHDCWVRLDCDTDPVEDLPHYDW
ncbi:conserved hypothetical protein [Pseudomonas sp. OF001]|uniref:DUF5983 family protein n=1 Tax=Pseudomonas sp. OF001 TaxID=2772300 RepID=UPI00191A1984|nr:hypothetical protein [Pseudomonas sp. OF001]CAD5377314.1 conserved hypothetical protein [Pseudomonas sp. OF001]